MLYIFLCMLSALAGTATVEILDVGQGDAILVRSPEGKTLLIDGGTGKVPVVPYLQERGITEINLMVGTHPHADHIGGLDEVLAAIPTKVYMDNGLPHTTQTYTKVMNLVESKGIQYISAKNGQKYNLGSEITLEVWHPQDVPLKNTRSDLNSNSVVIRMMHKDNCFMFVGDAEEPTEHTVVQKNIGQCKVLKVAHHGSNHSSSQEFLNHVQPEIALISLGVDNSYGHPGEETMERLEKTKAKIYRTDTMGTITILSDGKKLDIQTKKSALQSSSTHYTKEKDDSDMDKMEADHGHASTQKTSTPTTDTNTTGKFNINTATQAQLESISGIGPSKASAIIAYRTEHGPFKDIADVVQVSGIGPSTASKIAAAAYAQ